MYIIRWNNFKIQHKRMYITKEKKRFACHEKFAVKAPRCNLLPRSDYDYENWTSRWFTKAVPSLLLFYKEVENGNVRGADFSSRIHDDVSFTTRTMCFGECFSQNFSTIRNMNSTCILSQEEKKDCWDSRVLYVPLYHQTSCCFFPA